MGGLESEKEIGDGRPVQGAPAPTPMAEGGSDESGLPVRDLARLVPHALRRHPWLASLVLVAVVTLVVTATVLMPRVYAVDVKILAQRPTVMSTLLNPHRPVPGDDAPARIVETILKRDNLVAIVKEANLVDLWDARRTHILKFKDSAVRLIASPPSAEDKLSFMVDLLEKKLSVQADETTIKLGIEWNDAQTAFDLIRLAQRNFLDGRNAAELAVIAETITILEEDATKGRKAIDSAMIEVKRLALANAAPPAPIAAAAPPSAPRAWAPAANAPGQASSGEHSIAIALAEKHTAIRLIEEPRQRRIAELRAQLADLRATYAPAHPAVIEMDQKVGDASIEPAELTKLKGEEKELLAEAESAAVRSGEARSAKPAPTSPTGTVSQPRATSGGSREEDPDLEQAKANLQASTRRYRELEDRIDTARIELQTGQAAFKYRYTVVYPAEFPKRAKKPNVPVLIGGGIFVAGFLAVLAAVAKDLLSGRFVESWQVDRRLKIPLLAQIKTP